MSTQCYLGLASLWMGHCVFPINAAAARANCNLRLVQRNWICSSAITKEIVALNQRYVGGLKKFKQFVMPLSVFLIYTYF